MIDSRPTPGFRLRPTVLCATVVLTFTLINSGVSVPHHHHLEASHLKYATGQTYRYDYETRSVVKLLGTSDEESEVKTKGQLLLTPGAANQFTLTLDNFILNVTSPNEKAVSPITALKGSTTRFVTDGNGVIKEFYIEENQSPWVSNYHRAVASAFNNYALNDLQQAFYLETDISGSKCPTEYKIHEDGTFKKTRDLNRCLNRDGGFSEQYGVPITPQDPEEPTSDTSIRSSQECIQKYTNGLLSSVECFETHHVTLLASGKDTGGNAQITTKLTLKDESPSPALSRVASKLCSILFDHTGTDLRPVADATQIVEALLGKLCLSTGVNGRLTADTSSIFLTLKAKIRVASKQVLENVYNKLKSGKICDAQGIKLETLTKLYTDAVLMAGSTDSIAFGAQLVTSGQVSDNSAKRFRVYTAMANRPGDAALEGVIKLLDSVSSGAVDSRYLLAGSGIAYQYCLDSKEECLRKPLYTKLVNSIATITAKNCQDSATGQEKSTKDAAAGLQALGNLNKLTPAAVDTIKNCLKQSDRVKIHALQAIRRDPCQEKVKVVARELLKDQANPAAHVRLSAYLALSQCYTEEDRDTIKSFIETEESIQVLSFLKSHREHAWAERSNEAVLDKGIFEGVNFEKVKTDPRKFSTSLDFTDGLEDFAVNMIYADDSFLPKIVYGNSSTKLFGQEFGLLEAGIHLGGFEQDLMELAFNEDPSKYWEKTHRRPRRQANGPNLNQQEITAVESKIRVPARNRVPTDVYFRLMGTTVYANSFGLEDLSGKKPYLKELYDRVILGEEISFNEAYPLYGDELIVPTVSGLSLWIHNEGVALVSLKYSTGTTNFNPKISPGVSLANKMKLTIAGDLIEAGLRVETTAAASTDITLTGRVQETPDDYTMEFRIGMPPSEVKLVEASNNLYWVLQTRHADYDQKQVMTTKTSSVIDTGLLCTKYLPKVTGVKACYEVKLPPVSGRKLPKFPLSGPAKVQVTLSPPQGATELVIKYYSSTPGKTFDIEIDAPGAVESIRSVFTGKKVMENGFEKDSLVLNSARIKAGISLWRGLGDAGIFDIIYKAYVDDKEYQLTFKRQYIVDQDTRRSAFGIRYQLPKEPEVTVFSFDVNTLGMVFGASDIFEHELTLTVNDFTKPGSKELFSYYVFLKGPEGTSGRTLNFKTRLTLREKQRFLIKGDFTKLSSSTIKVDADAVVNVAGADEDLKVQGELSLGDQKGFKGTTKSVSRPILNADVEVTYNAEESDLQTFTLNLQSPKISIKVLETIDRRGGKWRYTYDGKAISSELGWNKEKSYDVEVNAEKVAVTFRYVTDGKTVADVKFLYNKPTKLYDANFMAIWAEKTYALKARNGNDGQRHIHEYSIQAEGKFSGGIKTEVFPSTDSEGVWKNRETTLTTDQYPDPYSLKIKYKENAASVKVLRASQEIGVFAVDSKQAQNSYNFALKVFAEKIVDSTLNVKFVEKELWLAVEASVQSPPKQGVPKTVNLVVIGKGVDEPAGQRTFGLVFDLKLDTDKGFKLTNNNRWQKAAEVYSLESENVIVVNGKSRKANIKFSGQHAEVSKFALTFDHVNPEGKADKVEVSADVEFSHSKSYLTLNINGFGEGGKYELGLQKINTVTGGGQFVTKYTCLKRGVLFDIVSATEVKDRVRIVTASVKGFGFILAYPIQYDLTVETGSAKHKLNFVGGRGPRTVYVNVNLEKSKGAALKKFILDVDFDQNYNKERGPAITSKTTLAYRYNTVRDFEVQSTGQYDVKGDKRFKHEFNRKVKADPGTFTVDFSSKSERGTQEPERNAFQVNTENTDKRFLVKFLLEHKYLQRISGSTGVPAKIQFELDTTKNINDLQFALGLNLPSAQFEKGSIALRRTVSADETTRNGKFVGKFNDQTIDFTSDLVLTSAKKSAEVSLKLNNETPKKLSLKYDIAGGHIAEASYSWGDNVQVITSKGSVVQGANDGFTAKFEFDVPTMNQHWNLEVSREATSAKKTINFVAISENTKEHVKFRMEKDEALTLSYSATLNVDMAAPNDNYDFDGTLKATLDRNPAKSVGFLNVDYVVGAEKRSRSLSVDSIISPDLKQVVVKLSLAPDNKFELKSILVTKTEGQADIQNSFEFSLANQGQGLEASVAASLTMSRDRKKRVTTIKYALAHPSLNQKKELGITLYKKPGTDADLDLTRGEISFPPSKVSTRGVEIALPERTYGAHVLYADWESQDACAAELSLWFDKKTAPDQKLQVGYALSRAPVEEAAQGKNFAIILRHHKLGREMKLESMYRFTGSDNKIFQAKTQLDIFKRPEDCVTFVTDLTHHVASDSYILENSVVSEGQGFALVTKCDEITMDFPRFKVQCQSTKKASGVAFIHKLLVNNDQNGFSLKVEDGPSSKFLYFSRETIHRTENPAQIKSVRTQFQFPGMTDVRNIISKLSLSPFRYSLTTQPSSSKDSTNFWIGATSAQGGGFGLSRSDDAGVKKDLVSFSANVKGKKFQVHGDWSKSNIADYLAYVLKRGQEIDKVVTAACAKVADQEFQLRQALRQSLKTASQDFEPVLQWYETQLSQIGSKYGLKPVKIPRGSIWRDEVSPPESLLVKGIRSANKCIQESAASVNSFLDSLSRREPLPTPEAVKERARKVRDFVERLASKIRSALSSTKELKEKYPLLKKVATKLREKVVATLQSVLDEITGDITDMYPFPEVSQFLDHVHDYVEVALLEPEKISEGNKTEMLGDFEKAVEKVLAKTYGINFAQGKIRSHIPLLRKLGEFEKVGGLYAFGKSQSSCIKEFVNDPTSILPPVNATGYIVGSSNYISFDRTQGKFGKLCRYLLASDVVNKNVSVVLDLTESRTVQGDGSTLFVTDHKTTVGIIRGLSEVVVNGKVVQLPSDEPFRAGAFIVYKDAGFTIIEGMGVTLGCVDYGDICAVQVSGFYHGKLQGVLGKFNNNPNDDWTMSTGQVSTNDDRFQASWKLDERCSRIAGATEEIPWYTYAQLRPGNFFSRSSSSPHRGFFVVSSAPTVSINFFLSIVLTSIVALLLARFH